MKIIDLFNKIVKGEEVPKKIKYQNKTFELDDRGIYLQTDEDCGYKTLLNYVNATSDLYYKVEIIEEDKEIEEALGIILLGQCDNWLQKRDVNIKSDFELNPYILEAITDNFKSLYHKQCELVKAVNELKKGK